MKNYIALLALVVAANSNAGGWDDPYKQFDATVYTNREVSVLWKTVDNIQQACNAELQRRQGKNFGYALNACAFWDGDQCTILTPKTTSTHTLGHEMRHCFQGDWHK